MPSSRPERIAFGVGLALIVLLAILLLPAWHSYSNGSPRTAPLAPPPPSPIRTPASVRERVTSIKRKVALRTPARPLQAAAAPQQESSAAIKPAASQLRLTATRGDCWISVRTDSSSGPEVYVGTLVRGKSLVFPLGTVWVRMGAAQNLDALVAGRRTTVPTGSYNVIFTRSGAKPVP